MGGLSVNKEAGKTLQPIQRPVANAVGFPLRVTVAFSPYPQTGRGIGMARYLLGCVAALLLNKTLKLGSELLLAGSR